MPFSLGLYDLFVATIPGFLYLFVISEILRILGWQTIDVAHIDTIGGILSVTVAAFILGNVLGSISYKYWYKVFFRKHSPELSLVRLRKRYPQIRIEFENDDHELIFAVIRHHDKSLAERLETARVSSIMLRNISLGLFIYSILQIWLTFAQQQLSFLWIGGFALIFSAISLNRSITFHRWFFDSVFLEALNYGSNVHEVLSTSKKIVGGNEIKRQKSRGRTDGN
jgi:hypothetical protein